MSLSDAPPATLSQLRGRLETLQSEWTIAPSRARREEIDAEFKALAAEIRQKFGHEGQKAVEELLARHKQRNSSA